MTAHHSRRKLFGTGASLLLVTAAAAGATKAQEFDGVPHLECCNRKAPLFISLKDGRAIYSRILDSYGDRALLAEKSQGVDWKALSHAVRVGREALELLATGWITFPLPNAAHILRIKLGEVPYQSIADEIERLLVEVEAAQEASVLPAEPDHAFIDDLVYAPHREQMTLTDR